VGSERHYFPESASECSSQLQFFCPTSTPLSPRSVAGY